MCVCASIIFGYLVPVNPFCADYWRERGCALSTFAVPSALGVPWVSIVLLAYVAYPLRRCARLKFVASVRVG